jgi:hypothetical protein
VQKQDSSREKASVQEAEEEPLRIDSTPILFVNGEKVMGVVPIETLYQVIDDALRAEGQTPPPAPLPAAPSVPNTAPAATEAPAQTTPIAPTAQPAPTAVKPGS